jgi:SAM-dependent methyltransferase
MLIRLASRAHNDPDANSSKKRLTVAGATEWWQTFFSGLTVEWWLLAATAEQTRQEVDFIMDSLDVPAPARLLDVPCGGGRHCLALAEEGYDMTGVDISTDFLAAARGHSLKQPDKVRWEQREMRDLPWPAEFDGAYTFGNSFGYLDDAGNADFLKSVATALKPGARFVLETGYVTETLLPVLQERSWYPMGDILLLSQRRYDPVEGRLHVEYTTIRGPQVEKRSMSARVYSYREMVGLLEDAGFGAVLGYGSLTREPFRLGSRQALFIGTKC